jgi:hypothetical protein
MKWITVTPASLSITHIFEGEEVITGGEDGQVWVATFASAAEAQYYIDMLRLTSPLATVKGYST